MDVSWNHTVTCCYDQQYRHANRLYLQINEQIFLVWPCSLWLQKPSSKWWAFMKSTHLLSSNAFFSLVSRPELPHWLAPLFFSSRKAFFLISLALCSLVSLSLSAFNISSISRDRNVYDAQFFLLFFPWEIASGLRWCMSRLVSAWWNTIISVHYFILSDSFRAVLVPIASNREIKHLTNFPRTTRAKV